MAFEMDCGLSFQQFDNMTDEDKAIYEKEHPFNYANIDEYIADLRSWLMLGFWHKSEDSANWTVERNMAAIEEYFAQRAPVDLAGTDIGYCCG